MATIHVCDRCGATDRESVVVKNYTFHPIDSHEGETAIRDLCTRCVEDIVNEITTILPQPEKG